MGIITRIDPLAEAAVLETPGENSGFGALTTERGNLPLHRLDLRADVTGLTSAVRMTQGYRNCFDVPLEATYIFPLPDRAAVTALTMTVAGRVVHADLQERGAAREAYDTAIAEGKRASIAEEERPDVFTLRVGNIQPGEEAVIELTLAGPLPWADGQAEFRFPLVVAPRYIPGVPLPGPSVGSGTAPDTDAVPDASRITPPTLLPGFPNPVDLSIEVKIDPAGLDLAGVASNLHAVIVGEDGLVRIEPGERLNRDFVLRLAYTAASDSLVLVPDPEFEDEGTYQLTVMPPEGVSVERPRPKDLVLILDRSGSMSGWKMVAARRAAARIVDTLTDGDRFLVALFDHSIEYPPALAADLVPATDRNRFRAVEHLAKAEARGGTELLAPLELAAAKLKEASYGEGSSDQVVVLVTDGQVGNEDQILAQISGPLSGVRVHTVGIDQAVNAGFLGRLAAIGGGRCELVESEDRLDEAMDRIHRRIGSPTVTDLTFADAEGLTTIPASATPNRVGSLFPGVPLVRSGRYQGAAGGALTISGLTAAEGEPWSRTVHAVVAPGRSEVASIWARARLRDLEDRYAVEGSDALEQEIVRTSLRHGVLCRFTAYVAIDTEVAADGSTKQHKVTQLVEQPSGWEPQELRRSAPARPMLRAPGGAGRPGAGIAVAASAVFGGPAPAVSMPAPPAPGSAPIPPMPQMDQAMASEIEIEVPEFLKEGGGGVSDPVRDQAAAEARLLRASATEPAYRRRDLLDDLASRLDALVVHLRSTSGPRSSVTALQGLIAVLRDLKQPLEDRWAKALTLLEQLAGEQRKPFWKRG